MENVKVYLELQDRASFNEEGEDTIIGLYDLIVPLKKSPIGFIQDEGRIINAIKYGLDGQVKEIFCDEEKIIFKCDRHQGDYANELESIYFYKNLIQSRVEKAIELANVSEYTLIIKLHTLYS